MKSPDETIISYYRAIENSQESLISSFSFYCDLGPKVNESWLMLFDIGLHGINTTSKIIHHDTVYNLLKGIITKIDSTRKLAPEKWLRAKTRKKIPNGKKTKIQQVFNYLNHFNHFYHHYNVNTRTKIPARTITQQAQGIYEDVNSYSEFW